MDKAYKTSFHSQLTHKTCWWSYTTTTALKTCYSATALITLELDPALNNYDWIPLTSGHLFQCPAPFIWTARAFLPILYSEKVLEHHLHLKLFLSSSLLSLSEKYFSESNKLLKQIGFDLHKIKISYMYKKLILVLKTDLKRITKMINLSLKSLYIKY